MVEAPAHVTLVRVVSAPTRVVFEDAALLVGVPLARVVGANDAVCEPALAVAALVRVTMAGGAMPMRVVQHVSVPRHVAATVSAMHTAAAMMDVPGT